MAHFSNIIAEQIEAVANSRSSLRVPTTKETIQLQLDNMKAEQEKETEKYITEKLESSEFKEMKYHENMTRSSVPCDPEGQEKREKNNTRSRKSHFLKMKRDFIQRHKNEHASFNIVTCVENIESQLEAIAYCEKYLSRESLEKLREPYEGLLEDSSSYECKDVDDDFDKLFKASIKQLAKHLQESGEEKETETESAPELNKEAVADSSGFSNNLGLHREKIVECTTDHQESTKKIMKLDYED